MPLEDNGNTEKDNTKYDFKRYKWDDHKRESFLDSFRTILLNLKASIVDEISVDVNAAIHKIVNMFQTAASRMKIKPSVKHTNHIQPDWWDSDCDDLKKLKLHKLKLFRLYNTHTSLHEYIECRNNFVL